jgi:hypothetical protein
MTKEELRATAKTIGTPSGNYRYIPLMAFEDFLSSNICIPKGENRHPRADIYHEWFENTELTLEIDVNSTLPNDTYPPKWIKIPTIKINSRDTIRIKPQEPVYECMYYDKNGKSDWLTDDEFLLMIESKPTECYKANETKRIRK